MLIVSPDQKNVNLDDVESSRITGLHPKGRGHAVLRRFNKPQPAPTSARLVYVPDGSPNESAATINPVSKPADRVQAASADESPQWVDNLQESGIRSQK